MNIPLANKLTKYILILALMIILSTTLVSGSIPPASPFAGGTGSSSSPYQISTVDQLQEMKNYKSSHFILINDIDASGTRTWNSNQGFIPIGDHNSNIFTGSFDGRGYNITGLYIDNSGGYVGLFGGLSSDSTVENVSLVNVDITGSSGDTGGLCGIGYGTIANVSVTGNISDTYTIGGVAGQFWGNMNNSYFIGNVTGSNSRAGGLVGYCYGNINNSYAIGNVTSQDNVGGLVGIVGESATGSQFHNCYADVDVNGQHDLGGLIGCEDESDCTITNCYATGNVTGLSYYVGGLIGNNQADLDKCYATGNVVSTGAGANKIGGLVGLNYANIYKCYATGQVTGSATSHTVGGLIGYQTGKWMEDCYARGNVTGGDKVGGLIGENSDFDVYKSYSTGKVTGSTNTGGLIGSDNSGRGFTTRCYWDTETSGMTTSATSETGKNTSEMKTQSTYSNWDFPTVWDICYNATSS